MIARLRGAIGFLTIIPVHGGRQEPARAAVFFPLVGAALGAAGAGLFLAAEPYLPVELRALGVLVFWIVVTGALHEDGLADVADACRAGRGREQMFAILQDPRIGTYGAVAIAVSVLVRWQAMAATAIPPMGAFVAAMTLSRAAMVVLAKVSRPAGQGLGGSFVGGVSSGAAVLAAAQGIAAALWCGPRAAALLPGAAMIVVLSRWYFHRRLGGVTGDCLGAAGQVVEMFVLTAAVWTL